MVKNRRKNFKLSSVGRMSSILGLDFTSDGNRIITHLEKGNYFGEISLITGMKRTATVAAIDYCTLASISKEDFMKTEDEFP